MGAGASTGVLGGFIMGNDMRTEILFLFFFSLCSIRLYDLSAVETKTPATQGITGIGSIPSVI
jgi:hypothetical protein